jgi:hypothetical protein
MEISPKCPNLLKHMHSCNDDNYAKEAVSTPVMQGNVIRIAMLKKLNTSATLTLCLNKKNTIGQNMEVGL